MQSGRSAQIYILKDGQQEGPYSVEQLDQLLQLETITGENLYWQEGCKDWQPLSRFPGFVPSPVAPELSERQPSTLSESPPRGRSAKPWIELGTPEQLAEGIATLIVFGGVACVIHWGIVGIFYAIGIGVSTGLYLLPTFIASKRNAPHRSTIVVINIFLGWTLLGWIAALIWSIVD